MVRLLPAPILMLMVLLLLPQGPEVRKTHGKACTNTLPVPIYINLKTLRCYRRNCQRTPASSTYYQVQEQQTGVSVISCRKAVRPLGLPHGTVNTCSFKSSTARHVTF